MDRYYFGYGANMTTWVMAELCTEFDVIGVAYLPDHRLAFTRYSIGWRGGVCDVVYAPGEKVWGVLFQLADKCHDALDQQENFGVGYTSMGVDVFLQDGTPYHAMAYTVIDKAEGDIPPSREYYETIMEGASQFDFPAEYMELLKSIKVAER